MIICFQLFYLIYQNFYHFKFNLYFNHLKKAHNFYLVIRLLIFHLCFKENLQDFILNLYLFFIYLLKLICLIQTEFYFNYSLYLHYSQMCLKILNLNFFDRPQQGFRCFYRGTLFEYGPLPGVKEIKPDLLGAKSMASVQMRLASSKFPFCAKIKHRGQRLMIVKCFGS